jgi:hypothetical protein
MAVTFSLPILLLSEMDSSIICRRSEEFESPCLTFLAIEVSRICSKLGVDFSSANIIHINKGLIYEANYNSISWKVL